jgi:hypothetical protein
MITPSKTIYPKNQYTLDTVEQLADSTTRYILNSALLQNNARPLNFLPEGM